MNKIIKKLIIYISISLILSSAIVFSYTYTPETLKSIDNRLRDYMFILRGEKEVSPNVVIIDIDEKSLKEIGQWPWSRNIISKLLNNLNNAKIGIIGFDIVFAEEDRTSPHKILKDLNITTEKEMPNYDEILAKTIISTPTILGYQFQMESESFLETTAPSIPAILIEKNKKDLDTNYVLNAKGSILNIPILQENSYSSGFFNNVPDPSGVVRSVPLIIRYDEQLFPSLSLEIIRAFSQTRKITINYFNLGVYNVEVGNYVIPTDRAGRLIVNFRGKERKFEYISAVDIINNKFNKDKVQGKIALVGTSAAGLLDLRATPFESIYPGVEVHATAIDNILQGEYLSEPASAFGANIVIICIVVMLTILIIAYVSALYIPLILLALSASILFYLYYEFTVEGNILNIFFPIFSIVLSSIVGLIINYFLEKKNELLIKKKFASKVSKEVMESLLSNPDKTGFEAMDKEITVFFSDVRDFTSISESMANPRELINYLNEYMTPMTNIIIEEKGTIDKYIGDAIMAYWNAPGDVKNHSDRALNAAIRQLEYLVILNKDLEKRSLPLINIGIGLNTGTATVGEMGSEQRSDYTCIGDSINLGARLESLCKGYGAKIIISEFVKKRLKNSYQIRNLDLVRVKGKTKPVEIFEIHGIDEGKEKLKEELKKFNLAVKLYRESNFTEAIIIFKEINNWKEKENTVIYDTYISRCKNYIEYPPENFDGVYTHKTKG